MPTLVIACPGDIFLNEFKRAMTKDKYIESYIFNDKYLTDYFNCGQNDRETYIKKMAFLVLFTFKTLLNHDVNYQSFDVMKLITPTKVQMSQMTTLISQIFNTEFKSKYFDFLKTLSYEQIIALKQVFLNTDYLDEMYLVKSPYFHNITNSYDILQPEFFESVTDLDNKLYKLERPLNTNNKIEYYQKIFKANNKYAEFVENEYNFEKEIKRIMIKLNNYNKSQYILRITQFENIVSIYINTELSLEDKFKYIFLNLYPEQLIYIGYI